MIPIRKFLAVFAVATMTLLYSGLTLRADDPIDGDGDPITFSNFFADITWNFTPSGSDWVNAHAGVLWLQILDDDAPGGFDWMPIAVMISSVDGDISTMEGPPPDTSVTYRSVLFEPILEPNGWYTYWSTGILTYWGTVGGGASWQFNSDINGWQDGVGQQWGPTYIPPPPPGSY